MLELSNIKKVYEIGKKGSKDYQVTHALRGLSVKFRKSEFVSILGPSGCGKTTLLNIVGGLDKYTSGDLIIYGRSTKEYKDADWDNYRNNSVGFVFQSYNLIPHQTILENVELALTLSGVKSSERKQKALAALEKVGLKEKVNVRPNQLSGGQMQRVAIARALVNDPEIILADEPTGALDTKTSIQVMKLLKEVSRERLVIMVTHNPELAKEYSTRIITMLDGNMTDDSNPLSDEEIAAEKKEIEEKQKVQKDAQQALIDSKKALKQAKTLSKEEKLAKKAEAKAAKKNAKAVLKGQKKHKKRMSFFTALSLSFKNLLTKKARTALVGFAGSIGIIGIALILSLSSGFQSYIDRVQKDTLSTYPITISKTTTDFTKVMETMMGEGENVEYNKDKFYSNDTLTTSFAMLGGTKTNKLQPFKQYIETDEVSKKLSNLATIKYTYNLPLNIFYTSSQFESADKALKVSPLSIMGEMKEIMPMLQSFLTEVFEEMLDNQTLLSGQYDVVKGRWADNQIKYDALGNPYSEVVVVLDKNNQIPDYALMSLGLRDIKELDAIITGKQGATSQPSEADHKFSMDISALESLEYNLVLNPDLYNDDDGDGIFTSIVEDLNAANPISSRYYNHYVADKQFVEDNTAIKLKVVGVVKPNPDATAGSISGTIGYTKSLTDFVIGRLEQLAQTSGNALNAQLSNNSTSVLTGQAIDATTLAETLITLGSVDKNDPASISFYAVNFEAKDGIEQVINDYNNKVIADTSLGNKEERESYVISYTDYVGLMMSSISVIINAITYVLIAFVSISLVVSSIMIGIITYISVLERTKEIGVLRSVGASKKDIKRVFTAESLIIGLFAGLLGIIITLILIIPINIIIESLSGIAHVAALPWLGALVLIAISMLLTFIAGLFPAKLASKKDPVIALRTE